MELSAGEQPETTQERKLTLPPPGECPLEEQLSPEEIVQMKERLHTTWGLVPTVCTSIVMRLLLKGEEEIKARRAEVEANGGSFLTTGGEYATREEFAQHVGQLSADWALSLQKAIDLPGSEWPEHMSSPAIFARKIAEVDRATKEANMAKDVARWLFDNFDVSIERSEDQPSIELEGLSDDEGLEIFEMLAMAEDEEDENGEQGKVLSEFGELVLDVFLSSYSGLDRKRLH